MNNKDYKKALDNIRFYCGNANYDEYLNPKVFEELNIIQELVDKATPKKTIKEPIIRDGYRQYKNYCPICKQELLILGNYCLHCGQAVDWSDNDEFGDYKFKYIK